jgi:hypothetical protein
MIPSVDQFTEENSYCRPAEPGTIWDVTIHKPIFGKHVKYLPQFYGEKLSDENALIFPYWNFGYSASEVFKSGCWEMWLCRMFGTVPDIQDDAACLDTYRILFSVCTNLLEDFYDGPVFPWPEAGFRFDTRYDMCLPWLFCLMTEVPQRQEFGGERVIDDVGIASGMVLRLLRDEYDEYEDDEVIQNNLRGFTEGELRDALDTLLTKATKYYTARAAADELKKRHPDRTIGPTKVGECPVWKDHVREWKNQRAPRNTSRKAADEATRRLGAQQQRNMDADEGKRVKGNRIQGTD